MASEILFEKRGKQEYECTLGPKLMLIAEKPLKNDQKEIFDSPQAMEYLATCFKSKYKSVETHITYIKDIADINFSRKVFFTILQRYVYKQTLDIQNFAIGFVGQSAFEAFKQDYAKSTDTNAIECYLREDMNALRVWAPWLGKESICIPYVILPEVNDNLNNLIPMLNSITKTEEITSSPYCDTNQILSKFNIITDLYEEGSLKYFKFDAKVNINTRKLEYFKVFDKYTNKELLYCPTDEICKNDTRTLKQTLYAAMEKALGTVPVYGDNIQESILLFKCKDQVKIISDDEINERPPFREYFAITEIETNADVLNDASKYWERKGLKSDWYASWHKNTYVPHFRAEMSENFKLKNEFDSYEIKDKYEWIYDIEVFKDDFLIVAYTPDKKYKMVSWNAFTQIREWVRDKILIGFNNAAYDDAVLKYAIAWGNATFEEQQSMLTVKQFSDALIMDDDKDNGPIWGKGVPRFLSWDISFHGPFDIRRNSLKKLTMSILNRRNYDSAVPFDIDRPLTKLEREEVERYCEMDVDNTLSLFLPDENNPKRPFARDSYDIRWNMIIEYKMKAKTLINKASSFAGKLLCGEETKPNIGNTYKLDEQGRKEYYKIPNLAFKELAGTDLLDFYIKNQHNPHYITEKFEQYLGKHGEGCADKFDLGEEDKGQIYQFGFGGLHQALLNYGSKDLVNMDVASLYPSLLVEYKLMSRGAYKQPESYEEIYKTRLAAKRDGKKLLNEGLKLILNGSIGAMLSRFNPLYDTWSNSSVCVHGQLLLYILVKRLFDAGFNIIQTNTDGIMIERQENVDFMEICNKWQEETKLILEFDEIDILQQNNVNNYYCQFKGGYVKSKGFYLSNEKFGKATSKILCNLVTDKDPLDDVMPRDFVIFKKHSVGEIYDAITREKVEGRSLAFVVGHADDPRTQGYYSRSRNARKVVKKDEKGKPILIFNEDGTPKLNSDGKQEQEMEIVNTESKITGFTDNMLLVDDINAITMEEINTSQYISFAKNLLNQVEVFGPYFTADFVKVDEESTFQALNAFKDNTDTYARNNNVVCQNFLFECDYLTKEEQEELIEKCKDKLWRVVWSGNRSYHCIVRINKPVTVTTYRKIWAYLQYKLGFMGADLQAAVPSKYTRVPDQINPKTNEMQTLYYEGNNILNLADILEEMPVVKEEIHEAKKYTGKVTIEALEKHIKKQNWDEGNRFAAVQKLSPILISQVTMGELLEMIPVKLDKDHKFVIRSKYYYWEKNKPDEEE